MYIVVGQTGRISPLVREEGMVDKGKKTEREHTVGAQSNRIEDICI